MIQLLITTLFKIMFMDLDIKTHVPLITFVLQLQSHIVLSRKEITASNATQAEQRQTLILKEQSISHLMEFVNPLAQVDKLKMLTQEDVSHVHLISTLDQISNAKNVQTLVRIVWHVT